MRFLLFTVLLITSILFHTDCGAAEPYGGESSGTGIQPPSLEISSQNLKELASGTDETSSPLPEAAAQEDPSALLAPETGPYHGPDAGETRDLYMRLPEDAGEVVPVIPEP